MESIDPTISAVAESPLVYQANRIDSLDSFSEKSLWIFQNDLSLTLLIGGICALILYYVVQIQLRKYRRKATHFNVNKPPLALSAPAIRYLYRQGYDSKSIMISLVDATIQGCYRIKWGRKGFVAERNLNADFSRIPELERNALSRSKLAYWDRVAVRDLPNGVTRRVGNRLEASLKHMYGDLLRKNIGWLVTGILFSVAMVFSTIWSGGDLYTLKWFAIYLGIFGMFVMVPLIFLVQVVRDKYWYGIFNAALFLSVGVGILMYLESRPGVPYYSVAVVPFAMINVAFSRKMASYTSKGQLIMDHIFAYRTHLEKQFERVANGQKELAEMVDELPYALALDIEVPFTRYFDPLLSKQKYEPYQIFDQIYG